MAIIRARIDGIAVDLERPKPRPKPKKRRKRKPGTRIAAPKTLPTVLKAMAQVRSSKLEILSLKRIVSKRDKEILAIKEAIKKLENRIDKLEAMKRR